MTIATLKFLAVLIGFVSTFAAELLWPADTRLMGSQRIWRNLGLAFVNFLLGPILVVPISLYASTHGLGLRPDWWNIGLDLLALDLWIYFWHRLNHIIPLLWRFHEVHHCDEMLDATSALRFHFGEVVLSAIARASLIWLLSMPLHSVLVFETFVVLAAIFQHSNLRLPVAVETILAKMIVTPSLHWVHHHALREDTDSNYSTVLSIWDRLFRSMSKNPRKVGMKMGVEGLKDLPLPNLILQPFAKRD